jgi:hypothetical protein
MCYSLCVGSIRDSMPSNRHSSMPVRHTSAVPHGPSRQLTPAPSNPSQYGSPIRSSADPAPLPTDVPMAQSNHVPTVPHAVRTDASIDLAITHGLNAAMAALNAVWSKQATFPNQLPRSSLLEPATAVPYAAVGITPQLGQPLTPAKPQQQAPRTLPPGSFKPSPIGSVLMQPSLLAGQDPGHP